MSAILILKAFDYMQLWLFIQPSQMLFAEVNGYSFNMSLYLYWLSTEL